MGGLALVTVADTVSIPRPVLARTSTDAFQADVLSIKVTHEIQSYVNNANRKHDCHQSDTAELLS
jgi:hypothetical protein